MAYLADLLRFKPRYATEGELRQAEAIFAVPFNLGDASNAHIARVVGDLQKKLGVKVFTQWEIGEYVYWRGVNCPHTTPGSWVKTHELLEKIKEMCPPPRRVMMVGHPHHVWRCALIARRMGYTVCIPRECETVPYGPGGQWWCNSPWVYIPWEYASRCLLFLRGKI